MIRQGDEHGGCNATRMAAARYGRSAVGLDSRRRGFYSNQDLGARLRQSNVARLVVGCDCHSATNCGICIICCCDSRIGIRGCDHNRCGGNSSSRHEASRHARGMGGLRSVHCPADSSSRANRGHGICGGYPRNAKPPRRKAVVGCSSFACGWLASMADSTRTIALTPCCECQRLSATAGHHQAEDAPALERDCSVATSVPVSVSALASRSCRDSTKPAHRESIVCWRVRGALA